MAKDNISAASAAGGTINTQAALDQFGRASQIVEEKYPGALTAFQAYVQGGSKGSVDQNTQAQLATLPVSDTAKSALEELRGFMGLPAISPTAGLSAQVNNLVGQLQNDPNAGDVVSRLQGLRSQLDQAESISDPDQRAIARDQITQDMSDISGSLGPEYQNVATSLQSVGNQFNAGYGQETGSAWSPEVIQAKLEADPAYQFRLNQGMKSLERTAAAKGGLLSGNTLAQAQEFGQGLASQQYDKRIGQLQNLASSTQGGINQQAGLLQNMGQQVNQTGQQLGGAAGDIYKGIAQAGQQSAQQQGQGLLQAAGQQAQMDQQTNLSNAQLQQQASMANQQAGGASAGLVSQLLSKV